MTEDGSPASADGQEATLSGLFQEFECSSSPQPSVARMVRD